MSNVESAEDAPGARKDSEIVGNAVLRRLILWFEKEAHLAGANVEAEVASILAKLEARAKKAGAKPFPDCANSETRIQS